MILKQTHLCLKFESQLTHHKNEVILQNNGRDVTMMTPSNQNQFF